MEEGREMETNGRMELSNDENVIQLDSDIRSILACPLCSGPLDDDSEGRKETDPIEQTIDGRLVCPSCDRWYPVSCGLPFLLPGHEDNLEGEKLKTRHKNIPGIAPKKARRFRWYYERPKKESGVEEGEEELFEYRDMNGWILDIGTGDRDSREALDPETVEKHVSMDIIPRDRPTVVADAHKLPFRDGSFDAVIARALIEHVEIPDQVISEVSRVLKPGGTFKFSAPFIYPIHDAIDYHRFTIYSIRSMAKRHGFDIIQITSTGGYFGVLAQHVFQGLQLIRDHIDAKYDKRPAIRMIIRFFMDIFGMIIYIPPYALRSKDKKYRKMAVEQQGRIPFVKGYGAVFRKK